MKPPLYSWIIPIKNEAESLPQLFQEIKSVMRHQHHEIIAINDASTDSTAQVLSQINSATPQLKIISSQHHRGKWAALETGFQSSLGQIIITLDADLQDDPRQLPKLLKKFNSDYDLVSGRRQNRQDPFYKKALSSLGNLFISTITTHKFHDLNSPFKIYHRRVLKNLPTHGSLIRFSLLFTQKLGYKTAEVKIRHRPRRFGRSKFGLIKYLRIIFDLFLVLLLFSGSSKINQNLHPYQKTRK